MPKMRTVIVADTDEETTEAISRRLEATGWRVLATTGEPTGDRLALATSDDASVSAAVADVLSLVGRIDGVVIDVRPTPPGPGEDDGVEHAERLFAAGPLKVHRMARAVLPSMRAAGRGRIVVLSPSQAGERPRSAIQDASVQAIRAYMESLDADLRGSGIRCILIDPPAVAPLRRHGGAPEPGVAGRDRPDGASHIRPSPRPPRRMEEAERLATLVLLALQARRPRGRLRADPLSRFVAMVRSLLRP